MKNRVRELREAQGWTQADFGEKLNVSRQTIYAIESEVYDPSLPLALAIARLFGCAVEEIFDDESGNGRKGAPAKGSKSGHKRVK